MLIARKVGKTLQELTWNSILASVVESLRTQLEKEGKPSLIPDAVRELYERLEDNALYSALLADAVRRTGLDDSIVFRRLEQLKGFLVEAQEGLETLLLPIGEPADQPIDLDYSILDAKKELPVGGMVLLLGAESAAGFSIRNFVAPKLPYGWEESELKSGRALLQTRLHGDISVRGSLAGAFGSFGFDFRGARERGGTVKLFHEFSASRSRAEALLTASRQHAPPWDLRALQKTLVRPDALGGYDGFRRIKVHHYGKMSLVLNASIGASYSYEGSIGDSGVSEASVVEASVEAGAKLKSRVGYESSVSCSLEKQADGSLLVSLESDNESVRAHDFSLGVEAEVDGLGDLARQYTDRLFEKSDALVEDLRPWTRPGEVLLQKVDTADWSSDAVKRLGQFLLGESERDTSAVKAGRECLVSQITRQLDKRGLDWLQDPESRIATGVEEALERLAISEELSVLLVEDVTSRLMSHWSSVEDDLETRLKDAFAEGRGAELLEALTEAGVEFDGRLESIREFTSSELKPFKRFLNSYDQMRRRVEAALEKSAHTRLGLLFFSKAERTRDSNVLLSFNISTVNPETISIFRALLLGNVDLWSDSFTLAREKGCISDVSGLFESVLEVERSMGFKFNLGEFSFERSRTRIEEVELVVDESGTINAASASLRNVATSASSRGRRQTSLIGVHDFMSSALDPENCDGALNLAVSYSSEDADSTRLHEFIESMEQTRSGYPLIPRGAADRAISEYENRVAAYDLDSVSASANLHLSLTIRDLQGILSISEEEVFRGAVDVQLDNVLSRNEYDTLDRLMSARRRGPEDYYELVQRMNRYRGIGSDNYDFGRLLTDLGLSRNSNLQARLSQRFLGKLYTIRKNATGLIDAINALRSLSKVHSRLSDSMSVHEWNEAKDLQEDIAKQLRQLNRRISPWLQTTGLIRGLFSESVHPNTLALLLLLRDVVKPESYLIPVLQIEDVEDGVIVVV